MAGPLPKYVAFTSSSKTKFFRPTGSASLLKFEEVDLFSRGVKHEIVNSTSEPGKVHIKCVDTGKYWTWGFDSSSKDYIAAQATKPLSDRSSNKCTLVKYSRQTTGGVSVFTLRFLWNSEWHTIRKDGGQFLKSGKTKGSELYHEFIIVDWEQLARARQIAKNTKNGASNGNPKQITGASNGVVEVADYQMRVASNGVVKVAEYKIRRVVYKK